MFLRILWYLKIIYSYIFNINTILVRLILIKNEVTFSQCPEFGTILSIYIQYTASVKFELSSILVLGAADMVSLA